MAGDNGTGVVQSLVRVTLPPWGMEVGMSVIDAVAAAPDEERTRAALFAAVEGVRAVLAANADAAERDGKLPEPAWRALHEAGLFRIKAPRSLGGFEADPLTQIEVFEAVSYIDTSAGWNLIIGAGTLAAT